MEGDFFAFEQKFSFLFFWIVFFTIAQLHHDAANAVPRQGRDADPSPAPTTKFVLKYRKIKNNT
jgi:hypothetical protein